MIVNRQQLKEFYPTDFYSGEILHNRFAYRFFKEKVTGIGNIITFRAPMEVTENLVDLEDALNKDYIYSEDAINFCIEIPNIDLFGGICFQRLFNSQLATILANEHLRCEIEVDGDDIIVYKEHNQGGVIQQKGKASVSIANRVNGAVLIHTGINITAGKKAPAFAFSTNLTDAQAEQFMRKGIELFYTLAHDVFVASTKVI
jgi:hypothetical protein